MDHIKNMLRYGAETVHPSVYSGYLGMVVKKGLKTLDTEEVLRDIGTMETIGDCRYAISATDFNGTKYRITVEVAK